MLDGLTCVYRSNVDLFFYVIGGSHENEVCILAPQNKKKYSLFIPAYFIKYIKLFV